MYESVCIYLMSLQYQSLNDGCKKKPQKLFSWTIVQPFMTLTEILKWLKSALCQKPTCHLQPNDYYDCKMSWMCR